MNPEQTSVYVGHFYDMDPEHEDLLPSGTDLADGMIVLIADSLMRVSIPPRNAYDEDRAKENNRWCVVSNLTIRPRYDSEPLVSFIAEYPDGTKRKRTLSAHFSWFVKRDSIPGGAA